MRADQDSHADVREMSISSLECLFSSFLQSCVFFFYKKTVVSLFICGHLCGPLYLVSLEATWSRWAIEVLRRSHLFRHIR